MDSAGNAIAIIKAEIGTIQIIRDPFSMTSMTTVLAITHKKNIAARIIADLVVLIPLNPIWQ